MDASRSNGRNGAGRRQRTACRRVKGSAARALIFGACVGLITFSAVDGRGQNLKSTTQPTSRPDQQTTAAMPAAPKFKKMTLDELMNVEVTSVARRESTIGDSAAAVTVITQDDIRRTGAMSIPEALRMAPGMEVAQIDSNTWAVSARGFNNNTSDKLLVLMDGRSVYTPLYSGVFWDVQDTMIQDIDRIEVVRGPAGALWGANAVNGVVNIISKDAQDTQGILVSGGGGTDLRNFESARYGWQLNDNTFARVYFKHEELNETNFVNGSGAADNVFMQQGGFRIDSRPSPDDHLTAQGDIYLGNRDNFGDGPTDTSGGNFLTRWSHKTSNEGDIQLQMYYDRTNRDIPLLYNENRDTFDVDFQHHIPIGDRNDLTWGLGYRITANYVDNGLIIFDPSHRTEQLFSFFAQDEIQLVPDKLRLTLGTKVEHNDFTGFEVQPDARLLWKIDKKQSTWGAISRAVRTPTQLEDDLVLVAPTASLIGNKGFESEDVIAYELGYRVEPTDWLSADVSGFYNDYTNLRSLEFNGSIFQYENMLKGQTYGVEIGSTVKVTDWWSLRGAYTYLQVQFQTDPGSTDFSSEPSAGNDPQNQVYLRSSMNIGRDVDFDVTARYVSDLPNQKVPGYVAIDARVAWRPTEHLEIAVVGKNLFNSEHVEFGTPPGQNEIPQSVFGTVTFSW